METSTHTSDDALLESDLEALENYAAIVREHTEHIEAAKELRDKVIRSAHRRGGSLRRIGAAASLSHQAVKFIVADD